MAGAFFASSGTATFNAVAITNPVSAKISLTCDMLETTTMGASWKTYVAGFKSWTAEVEAYFAGTFDPDIATDFTAAAASTLTIAPGGTSQDYEGSAFVSDITPSVDNEAVETVTYSFQGTSTLTEAAV